MGNHAPSGLVYKDSKGHPLAQVLYRVHSRTGPIKIPFFYYCPVCKEFFESKVVTASVTLK